MNANLPIEPDLAYTGSVDFPLSERIESDVMRHGWEWARSYHIARGLSEWEWNVLSAPALNKPEAP